VSIETSLAVPRVLRPSHEEFRRYIDERIPVVIEGALVDWAAPGTWTFERLLKLVGNPMVRVQSRFSTHANDFVYKDVPFESLIESIATGTGTDYLGAFPLLDRAPSLWTEIRIPEYAGPLSLSPRAFIAPRGSFAPLHFDLAHGLSAQIVGRKKVVVVEFRRRDVLGNPDLRLPGWLSEPLDVEASTPGPAGLVPRRRWKSILEPGDLLFLPSRRHHFLRSLDATISLSFFWHTAPMRALRGALGLMGRHVT
jgi:lysine-specific demethylase 8